MAFDQQAVTVVEADTPLETLRVWDVTFPGYGSDPIKAWLTVPAAASGPLATIVQYQGYGGGRGLATDHLDWASAGFAHVFMDSRGQGGTWGRPLKNKEVEGRGVLRLKRREGKGWQ